MKQILSIIITLLLISVNAFASDIQFLTHSSDKQTKLDKIGELRGIKHAGKRAFYVEVIHEMMILMKVSRKIQQVPLARGLSMVQNENDYALFNLSQTPEREATVKWVGPIQIETDYFYEMKNAPTGIKTLEDAKKVKTIGVVRGGVHESTLLKNNFTNTYDLTDYKQCFLMLKAGRINLTATTSDTISEKLKEADISPDEIQQTPVVLIKAGGYLVFSKNIPDKMIRQWQDAFEQVKKSGKYEQLYNLYLLPEK